MITLGPGAKSFGGLSTMIAQTAPKALLLNSQEHPAWLPKRLQSQSLAAPAMRPFPNWPEKVHARLLIGTGWKLQGLQLLENQRLVFEEERWWWVRTAVLKASRVGRSALAKMTSLMRRFRSKATSVLLTGRVLMLGHCCQVCSREQEATRCRLHLFSAGPAPE